jgi:hypothetical protein
LAISSGETDYNGTPLKSTDFDAAFNKFLKPITKSSLKAFPLRSQWQLRSLRLMRWRKRKQSRSGKGSDEGCAFLFPSPNVFPAAYRKGAARVCHERMGFHSP